MDYDFDQVLKPAIIKVGYKHRLPRKDRWRSHNPSISLYPDAKQRTFDELIEQYGFPPRDTEVFLGAQTDVQLRGHLHMRMMDDMIQRGIEEDHPENMSTK